MADFCSKRISTVTGQVSLMPQTAECTVHCILYIPIRRGSVGNERPPPDTVVPNPGWPTPVTRKGGQCLCLGIQVDWCPLLELNL